MNLVPRISIFVSLTLRFIFLVKYRACKYQGLYGIFVQFLLSCLFHCEPVYVEIANLLLQHVHCFLIVDFSGQWKVFGLQPVVYFWMQWFGSRFLEISLASTQGPFCSGFDFPPSARYFIWCLCFNQLNITVQPRSQLWVKVSCLTVQHPVQVFLNTCP